MVRRGDLAHLPGTFGPPVLGQTLPFIRDAEGWATSRFERYGPVFKSHFMFEPVVLFAEPDAARQVLLDRNRTFSSTEGWDPTIGELFARGLMLRDFDDHRHHRRIMQAAFRSEAMSGYLDLILPIVAAQLAGWERGSTVDFYAEMKQLTLRIASRVFLGLPLGTASDRVNRAFAEAVAASVAPVRWEVPGSAYRRGMRARRRLQRFFDALIDDRRAGTGTDMLTRLCQAESDDGRFFTDDEIVDHTIFLLLAAHDTTTSTLATMAWELARNPELQSAVRAEAGGLGGGRLSWDERDALPLMDAVMKEAMRLHPAVPFIPRRALGDVDVAGTFVPAGTMISVSPLLIHRHPEVWTSPERFDPSRFSAERNEHKSHSHAYLPFGGGAHTCIGMHFAGLMAKAILADVLRDFSLDAFPGQQVQIQTVPIPKPRGGLPLRLEPVG